MSISPPYPRHREDTERIQVTATGHRTIYNGTIAEPWKITSEYDQNSASNSLIVRTMDDVVTPDWQKLSSQGRIINNPMDSVRTETTILAHGVNQACINRNGIYPNYYFSGFRYVGTSLAGTSNWSQPPTPSVSDSVIDEVITEVWAKVSLNEAEILVQAAEAHKTIASLISVFKRFWKIYRNLRKLKLKALAKEISPKELADRYMEVRYALRPLMYDIVGTINALPANQNLRDRKTFRAFKYSIADDELEDQVLWTNGSAFVMGKQNTVRTLEVRSGVLVSIESLKQLNIWGLTEPFQSAWELVPFSFIADWFFNVGKLIASWSPKLGLRTLASWYVATDATYKSSTLEYGINSSPGNYENYWAVGGTYYWNEVNKYRVPHPFRPILPVYDVHLDGWKIADLAIIARNFSGASNKWRI